MSFEWVFTEQGIAKGLELGRQEGKELGLREGIEKGEGLVPSAC